MAAINPPSEPPRPAGWCCDLLDHAPIALAKLDLDGAVVTANTLFQALVGDDGEGGFNLTAFRQVVLGFLAGRPVPPVVAIPGSDGGRHLVQVWLSSTPDGGALAAVAELQDESRAAGNDIAYQAVTEQLADAVLVIEGQTIVWASPATRMVLGRAPDDLVGASTSSVLTYLHPDDPRPVGVVRDGSVTTLRLRVRTGWGDYRWFELRIKTHVMDGDRSAIKYAVIRDVDEQVELTRSLQRLQANTHVVIDAVRAILTTGDGADAILQAATNITNARLTALLRPDGHGDLVVSAAHPAILIGMRAPVSGRSAVARCFHRGTPVWIDDAAADGRLDPALISRVEELVSPIGSLAFYPVVHHGQCLAVLVVGCGPDTDPPRSHESALELLASETALALHHQELVRELERLSTLDPLTGACNRRAWNEATARELPRAAREPHPLSVLLIDIDHFKQFNDTHGHAAGDAFLRAAAAAWQERLRPGDVLCRWGGEEFAVLLPSCARDGARVVADDLRMRTPAGATCSVGIAQWELGESADELIARADRRLYTAKSAGRDRVHT
jgi:diguanylate cyclase (GGDEF)-like protein